MGHCIDVIVLFQYPQVEHGRKASTAEAAMMKYSTKTLIKHLKK